MNLGPAIKTVRGHLGLSQEQLSAKTGLSQTTISQIENGVKQPSKKTVKLMCDAFKIPEAVLYILGIENTDVQGPRKKMFDKLFPSIKKTAMEIIGEKHNQIIE